jgi:hypothetical protein
MAEYSFLQQIESDYQLSLFDEHVTGTPEESGPPETLLIKRLRVAAQVTKER